MEINPYGLFDNDFGLFLRPLNKRCLYISGAMVEKSERNGCVR